EGSKQEAEDREYGTNEFVLTAYYLPAAALLIHAEDRFGIVFMTNLVNCFLTTLTHIQPVRAINHDAVYRADVLIGMDDAFRNNDRLWIIRADGQRHHVPVSRRVAAIVPHPQFEIGRPKEAKQIGLVDMLVWAASNAWIC